MVYEDKLKGYIEKEIETWNYSGSIQATHKGKIVYETSRGFSNIEFHMKNTMGTRYRIASVTKQFTAFAIMMLYDKGFIRIHEKANHYLPQNIQLPSNITVHELLSHTSDLYNFYTFEDDFYVYEDRLPYNKEQFFKEWILKNYNSDKSAYNDLHQENHFNYNNSNYNILAFIIEHVSGMDYAEYLKVNIFHPLGMMDSDMDNGLNILHNTAQNYMRDYGKVIKIPYTNPQYSIGAGGMVTTCDDMSRWYQCLKNRKLLSDKVYEIYFNENLNHYCYGLEKYMECGRVKYCHGGDFIGTSAYSLYYFDEDISVIILSNNESLNQYRLGNSIADIILGGEPKVIEKTREVQVSIKDLERYIGTYLPGKIEIEVNDGRLYLVRINQNIHIELYCVGEHNYIRRFEEQQKPHCLIGENGKPTVWGYTLQNE